MNEMFKSELTALLSKYGMLREGGDLGNIDINLSTQTTDDEIATVENVELRARFKSSVAKQQNEGTPL